MREKSARHVAAGKVRARSFTREHQQHAGRAGYQVIARRYILESIRPDGTLNAELAAQKLSCFRLDHGFQKSRGLTSAYMQRLATELYPDWSQAVKQAQAMEVA